MTPGALFSYGLTKSGSTLAFQLARVALLRAGHPQPKLTVPGLIVAKKINAIQHVTPAQADALWDELAQLAGPVVLKTHTQVDPAVAGMIARGRAVAHIVLRDPRDVALSMLDNARLNRRVGRPAFTELQTLEDCARAIENQIEILRGWATLPGALILTYDEVAFDTPSAAASIAAQLGIPCDPQAVAKEVIDTCFTQFNKGLRDRHRDEMDPETSQAFRRRFAAFYDDFLPGVDTAPVAG